MSAQCAIILPLLSALLLASAGCGIVPKIVVMRDPLSAEEHNDLGVAYERKGTYALAEDEYRAAQRKRTDWHLPAYNLGNLYYRMRRYDDAEERYRAAIALDPRCSDCMNNLAWLLRERGRLAEARALAERALAVRNAPEYADTLRIIAEDEKRPSGKTPGGR